MNNKKELVFANSFLSNTQATLIGSPVKFVKMQSVKSFTLITLTALVLTACGDKAPAGASSATSTDVKARQDLMQDWRGANDILKGMMENPTNFDAATFKEQAEFISGSTTQMWTHFNDANAKGNSQDAVWSDATGFQTKKDEFDAAAQNLVAVATTAQSADDVNAAFGAMAEGCGSCHKVYKK